MAGTAPLLLLSMPQMADPNFARTVVLLCDYTAEDGAFGLVVNRQMNEPACEIVRTEPPVRVDPDLRLWIGGPVDADRIDAGGRKLEIEGGGALPFDRLILATGSRPRLLPRCRRSRRS